MAEEEVRPASGVVNTGQIGNVQTGSGTQWNIDSVAAGRDTRVGSPVAKSRRRDAQFGDDAQVGGPVADGDVLSGSGTGGNAPALHQVRAGPLTGGGGGQNAGGESSTVGEESGVARLPGSGADDSGSAPVLQEERQPAVGVADGVGSSRIEAGSAPPASGGGLAAGTPSGSSPTPGAQNGGGDPESGAGAMSTDAPAAGESGVHDKVTPLQAQTPGEGNFLPDYSADTVGRKDLKDLLDIGREVRAFARLIAARELEPPLSIGLFGEWGVR